MMGWRAALVWLASVLVGSAAAQGNRLTYLDENDPFHVGLGFPKLTTPQWVGDPEVEAVIILSIDDMSDPAKHEAFLRPILDRLKGIDGRAPVSVMAVDHDPSHPQLQAWLREGLSLEVHTLSHRHPILNGGDFAAGAADYHQSVAQLNRVPGNRPVAVRLPYCDSMNVASPRFYAEIFNRTNAAGQYLEIDSSISHHFTTNDPALPRAWVVDADGREKWRKYLPVRTNAVSRVSLERFATRVADYPYPYVIGGLCWEFPISLPSDWEAHNAHGSTNAVTVADWEATLDTVVLKQGVMTLCFHPHGWIRSGQIVGFIDEVVRKYGSRVKFLTFREAQERIRHNLLAGQTLRAADGSDNGVRLMDLDQDGYLDVVVANATLRRSRCWNPAGRSWRETSFPVSVVAGSTTDLGGGGGVRFGVLETNGVPWALQLTPAQTAAWRFDGDTWVEEETWAPRLVCNDRPVHAVVGRRDRGVRLRDVDADGRGELIVANESQNGIFAWSDQDQAWSLLDYALPEGTRLVDDAGRDAGLRFVDLNRDGYPDVLFSNPRFYLLRLFVSEAIPNLGWKIGWNDEIVSGQPEKEEADASRFASRFQRNPIPWVVREGDHVNNGLWLHGEHLYVQNEDTDAQPGQVLQFSIHRLQRADQPPPLTPQETLASIRVHPGFKVELVAQEPLTMDPVAFEWDEQGRLWVAEMGDYPLGMDGQGKPGGVIRFLEDVDGDGVYDRSTVFLDEVNFPNGVMPWRKGVLVSAAPEVIYAEDTDGDGRADVRKPLFVGFVEGNQQHRVNGFDYGLDNWIYAANGDSGGNVHSVLTGREVNIRGRDVRFRPDDGAFETQGGQTQYGRHRDDWGNWFGNNNINWLWHYYLPEHYLVRNPHLAVRDMRHLLAQYPNAARLYPISRFLQRPNWPDDVNLVTAASAAMPYRDELFGPEFASSVFICDPVYNVVHREVLEPDGVTFTSHRAVSEPDFEFFASSDNWCRPVYVKVGPDGALYVADMYRFVIEHPEWIPERMQQRLDLRAGDTLGRIYRVYPAGTTLRGHPRLDRLDTAGLVAALDHPNGWQRDTAQRLLMHRADPDTLRHLKPLLVGSPHPKSRVQMLGTLDGLGGLSFRALVQTLTDPHPAVREHAVRVSEGLLHRLAEAPWIHVVIAGDFLSRIAQLHGRSVREVRAAAGLETDRIRVGQELRLPPHQAGAGPADFREAERVTSPLLEGFLGALEACAEDPELRVRYQLAFTLGEWADARAAQALVRMARRDFQEPAMRLAIMSSAVPHVGAMLAELFATNPESWPADLPEQLLGLAVSLGRKEGLTQPLVRLAQSVDGHYAPWQFNAVLSLLDALDRRKLTLPQFREEADPELASALSQLETLFAAARAMVETPAELAEGDPGRLAAVRLLGRGLSQREEDLDRLAALLKPQVPPAVQQAALAGLGRVGVDRVGDMLLQAWWGYSPAMRVEALNVLFSRQDWLQKLLDAIEQEMIPSPQIDPAHQQTLLTHAQPTVRQRAQTLFAAARSDRQQVVEGYQEVVEMQGDASRGAPFFQEHCATCHQFRGQGAAIGADLGTVADKPVEYLLTAILDPNQAVEARFISYTALTGDEFEFSGIITAESPNSITLRNATGEATILRADLESLTSSSLSLMPEGFESGLKPQDLADLIAYLRSPP